MTRRLITSAACAALLLALQATPAAQAQPAPEAGPEVWRMTVHAQPATRPALEHALLPQPVDRTPGNAATLYMIAAAHARTIDIPNVDAAELKRKGMPPADDGPDMMYYFLGLPLEQIPAAELEAFLRPYEQSLRTLDVAVRRDFCRWDLAIRERGMDQAFTHLNDLRHLANVASLRARLLTAQGKHAEAARAASAIFRFAHDVGQEGMLIHSLVGVGLGRVGVNRAVELVQRPGAPNLYWPLAALPRPFLSLREAMGLELAGVLATFPEVARADEEPMTAEAWSRFVNRLPTLSLGARDEGGRPPTVAAALGPAVLGATLYPQAKQYLLDRGVPPHEVDAMPVPAALGRYVLGLYRTHFDELTKLAALPYEQSIPALAQHEKTLTARPGAGPAWFILHAVPQASRAAGQHAVLDRHLAALQTVEAIRAYAAGSGGTLPATLDDLVDTPAPPDPVTGKPFAYRVEAGGTRAIIESPAPLNASPRTALRIELTLAK